MSAAKQRNARRRDGEDNEFSNHVDASQAKAAKLNDHHAHVEEIITDLSIPPTIAAEIGILAPQPITEELSCVSWLFGTWTGNGKGAFPNAKGEEFYYTEEASFVPVMGQSAIMYTQRTWRNGEHITFHNENGFLRLGSLAGGPGKAQMLVSQVTGMNYVCEGEVGDYVIDVQSTQFSAISNLDGSRVKKLQRRLFLRGDGSLGYTVDVCTGEKSATGSEDDMIRCLEATLVPLAILGPPPADPALAHPAHKAMSAAAAAAAAVAASRPLMITDHDGQLMPLDLCKRKPTRNVPTPPRKDWGKLISYPNGKITVEVQRDKFEGDAICIQCRDIESTWDRSAWINCTFVDSHNTKHKVIQVSFEDKVIGRVYEIRAKVQGGQPTTMKQGGTLVVRAGEAVEIHHTMECEDDETDPTP